MVAQCATTVSVSAARAAATVSRSISARVSGGESAQSAEIDLSDREGHVEAGGASGAAGVAGERFPLVGPEAGMEALEVFGLDGAAVLEAEEAGGIEPGPVRLLAADVVGARPEPGTLALQVMPGARPDLGRLTLQVILGAGHLGHGTGHGAPLPDDDGRRFGSALKRLVQNNCTA